MGEFAAMNRSEVIAAYKKLTRDYKIANGQLWLSGGSALIILGLRDLTNDLDAGTNLNQFMQLSQLSKSQIKVFNISDGYLENDTRLITLPKYSADVHLEQWVMPEHLVHIDGVWCYSPYVLLEQKKKLAERLGRQKDYADIEALRKYILSRT